MIKISPSILSADFARLGKEVALVENGGADLLHIDVMDGAFVPNISFGPPVIKSIRGLTELIFDVHLMVDAPERYIDAFCSCGADILTVHAEATTHLQRTLTAIREKGMKAGVALNPATPLSAIGHVLDDVDMILLMTVNPGFGGQKFIPAMYEKIKDARALIGERDIDLETDGGIGRDNIFEVTRAGSNVIVAGSAIYQAPDAAKEIATLKDLAYHG